MMQNFFNMMLALMMSKFLLNDVLHILDGTSPMVVLYHATSVKPEVLWREGLRPPTPEYTIPLLSKELGIPLSDLDAHWLEEAKEDPFFYSYLLYPHGRSVRTPMNLFFWPFKPAPLEGFISRGLEALALDMVKHSKSHLSNSEVRRRLFSEKPNIVEVRIPGEWVYGVEPGLAEWLTGIQVSGETVVVEIEVARPIPPSYIVSIT